MVRPLVLTRIFLILAVVGAVGGWGGENISVIKGEVELDGAPLPEAQIQLIAAGGQDVPMLSGATDAAGQFTINAKPRPGKSSAGAYTVVVSKLRVKKGTIMDMEEIVPLLYTDRTKTPLKVEIKDGDNTLPP